MNKGYLVLDPACYDDTCDILLMFETNDPESLEIALTNHMYNQGWEPSGFFGFYETEEAMDEDIKADIEKSTLLYKVEKGEEYDAPEILQDHIDIFWRDNNNPYKVFKYHRAYEKK
jgi:hypothetical protein